MDTGKRALVADDMEANRKFIKAFLTMSHYQVDLASDGLEAKAAMESAAYDLLVSDIEMPNMNGFELLAWARQRPQSSKTPIIMLSSLDSPATIDRCAKLGASAYIVKPFTKEKFDQAFQKIGL